ncbi:DsbA family protein [Hoyosella subflava]|uniref:DSBA oxidoreductase n=1 Tax=Hoyosella subflava (strain DSM 45089 / JCM 17490 / NBRC 109087 / DQS3-9A1) TaxID=443218 RepID=F6EJ86_HOYSD|nr:thioredoxin domain-containing protein [Hoyosella subflava]AEF42502.1 DSBA oxidoreductase [Hoyosella subflava DQS3-9A1]
MNQRPKPGFVTQQQLNDKRRGFLIRAALTALVVVIGIVIVVVVINQRSGEDTPPVTDNVSTEGGIAFGPDDAAVTLSVYEDFQCPACQQFETLSGETLRDLADSGEARVVYHPIAILDRVSTTRYSTRAASVAMCVAEYAEDSWLDWQAAMYQQQPSEGGAGLTNEQMLELAANAGAESDELTECVNDVRYGDFVASTTRQSSEAGVAGTPTVLLNGEPVENIMPDGLRTAVQEAQ